MNYFETSRLVLRVWKETDLESFKRMNADLEVMKYFPRTLSSDETKRFYDAIETEFNEYGYGLYAVEIKENNEFIGFIGFHRATFEEDFTPCIEIGWRLIKEAWGKGFATEGATACLKHGFDVLGFNEIYSFAAEINKPSIHVMTKIGLSYVKDFGHPRVDKDSPLHKHVLYCLRKE